MRGRPPVTRARLLNYIASHKPRTIAQVARATGVDRSYVYRALRAAFGPHFRLQPDLPAGVGAGQKTGHDADVENLLTMDAEQLARFWAFVDKAPGHGPHGDCWLWRGKISPEGYPRFSLRGRDFQATHVSLFLSGHRRPSIELGALHSCDNRPCVREDHLRWGTDADNHDDMRSRGKRGPHWLSDEIVHEIHQSPETNKAIAERLGITASAVCNIRAGRVHKHVFEIYCHITRRVEAA